MTEEEILQEDRIQCLIDREQERERVLAQKKQVNKDLTKQMIEDEDRKII